MIATPPCQGMSVANHKKATNEIVRNSLVIESIKIIKEIKPSFFIFENVPLFMKTLCTDVDGINKPIRDAIENNLGNDYFYVSKVINFKNYGACSSRSRTLVVGVSKELGNEISPVELLPDLQPEKTLKDVIGFLPQLSCMGEIDPNDIYHAFRPYPIEMRNWIHNLKEGESAFDNSDDYCKPHQVIDGKIIINKQKNGDKYKRQYWNKVGPCVHTRNDQLASQNTIHPSDDRVFSIRELMEMMTVPKSFKWCKFSLKELNLLPKEEKEKYLKKEAIKIRQSLGEAVPTIIFKSIAEKIKNFLDYKHLKTKDILEVVSKYNLTTFNNLVKFIEQNPLKLSQMLLSRVAELSNSKRIDNSAYYTSKLLIQEITKEIECTSKDVVHILEPAVGVGNFVPFLLKKFDNKKIVLDLMDIDNDSLSIAKILLRPYLSLPNITINFINDDFLTNQFNCQYDYIIGNPPFGKENKNCDKVKNYLKEAVNKKTRNICSFFMDKALKMSNNVFFVFPKFLLNTPEFSVSRDYISKMCIKNIIDFGENGFPGVLIETIGIQILPYERPYITKIYSVSRRVTLNQNQKYITSNEYPYWIIYRDNNFDVISKKLNLGLFHVFRDRQITNSLLSKKSDNSIRVLKSRNISDNGNIIDIDGYDAYICADELSKLEVYNYIDRDDVYLTPNMTYKPRVVKKPKGCVMNGSVAILIPKAKIKLSDTQLNYFSTLEYRNFYQTARNYQTRSLNVDSCSVYFYGVLKEE